MSRFAIYIVNTFIRSYTHALSYAALKSSREVEYRKKVNEGMRVVAGRQGGGKRERGTLPKETHDISSNE